jgi:hypothetical protein
MRKFSLRGQLEAVDAASPTEDTVIFSYESSDLTRGWKVTGFHLWFTTVRDWSRITEKGIQFVNLFGKLQTDTIGNSDLNASDNREFAWHSNTYQCNQSNALGAEVNAIIQKNTWSVLDPDHVIVRELLLTCGMHTASDAEGAIMDVSYLVEIEEFKVSPTETVLQIVKGTGQSVS